MRKKLIILATLAVLAVGGIFSVQAIANNSKRADTKAASSAVCIMDGMEGMSRADCPM